MGCVNYPIQYSIQYRIDQPDGYGYSPFCHHLGKLSVARKSDSAIFEHDPGHRLQVDFVGDTPGYIDRDSGEFIKVQVFITVLPYSDYTFAIAVPRHNTDDFLYVLSKSLDHLGGVPQVLVPAILKVAIIKSDRYDHVLNKMRENFAEHYGLVVLPTRPRNPKDKQRIKNAVKLIYQDVFAKFRNCIKMKKKKVSRLLYHQN